MNNTICCIPADNQGNKLWVKDYREDKNKHFLKYKSTYNNMPFREVEVFLVDDDKNMIITGDDGTVLYRFSVGWVGKLIN